MDEEPSHRGEKGSKRAHHSIDQEIRGILAQELAGRGRGSGGISGVGRGEVEVMFHLGDVEAKAEV